MTTATQDEALQHLMKLGETFNSKALEEITQSVMVEGYTFGDFTDLNDEEIEAAYGSAFSMIEHGKHAEAEKLFRLLLMLDHHDHRFWMGLGASLQLQKKYGLANAAYTHLFTLDYENCIPPLRSAECLMNLGEYKLAAGAAIAAEAAAERKPQQYKTELACAQLILVDIAKRQS